MVQSVRSWYGKVWQRIGHQPAHQILDELYPALRQEVQTTQHHILDLTDLNHALP